MCWKVKIVREKVEEINEPEKDDLGQEASLCLWIKDKKI
jgi:hypothetical protein